MRKPSRQMLGIVAKNIRFLREMRNLSQEQLAEICDCHRTYVGSVERCERNVTLSTLETFAAAFRVSVTDLLTPNFGEKKQKSRN